MKPQLKVDNPIHHAGTIDLFTAIHSKDIPALKAFGKDKETDWMCVYNGNNVFHRAATSKKLSKTLLAVIPHDKKILLLKQQNWQGKTPLDLLEHYQPEIWKEARKILDENAQTGDNPVISYNLKQPSISSASHSLVHRDPLEDLGFYIPPEKIKLMDKLGEGQFGTIYRGYWDSIEVAVKKSHSHSPHTLNEYRKEALMMASLHCCYIVALKGIYYSPMSYSLVIEYMAGGSLTQILRSPKMLPWSKRHSIASNVAKGLAFLHNRRPMIIHRDIKSNNILLTEHEEAKLADFGLAVEAPIESSSGKFCMYSDSKLVGSLLWMAPECFDLQYSSKSDMYAYGIVLWEIISRKRPYDNIKNSTEIIKAVQRGEREEIPDEMTQLELDNPTAKTPQSIRDFIRHCWFHDAVKRPSADEAIKAFQEDIKEEIIFSPK